MNTLQQQFTRPHFCFRPGDVKASEFANSLMEDMGQYRPNECDIVVNVGGDGTILWSFHNNDVPEGVPDFALKPPGSSSALHNGHHNINNAQDLRRAFGGAVKIEVPSLHGEIGLSDGSKVDIRSYQDVVVQSFNSQAVLPQISVNDALVEQDMNCGIAIATPMGSTGINETFGGHILDMQQPSIALTLIGVTKRSIRRQLAEQGRLSRVLNDNAQIDISVSPTGTKRLTSIDFDSSTLLPDGQLLPPPDKDVTIQTRLRHIQNISVTVDRNHTRALLLNPEYRTSNAFS